LKIVLELDGWRKTIDFRGSVLSGRVEIGLYPPISILVERKTPIDDPMDAVSMEAVKVVFDYLGKHEGSRPIFEYVP